MKTWMKIVAAVSLCSLVGAGAAWASGPKGRARMMKHMIAMRVEAAEDAVEATDAQRKVIDDSVASITAKLEARMAAHQGQRAEWLALLSGDSLDPQAIYAKVDAKADEAKAVAREIVPDLVKIHGVLTPTQRQKLAEHAKKMHHRGPGHGPGHGPGFGAPGGFGGEE
jgi:Spy/CpxP family protein refolding chaperone